jgi:hypothetical protein
VNIAMFKMVAFSDMYAPAPMNTRLIVDICRRVRTLPRKHQMKWNGQCIERRILSAIRLYNYPKSLFQTTNRRWTYLHQQHGHNNFRDTIFTEIRHDRQGRNSMKNLIWHWINNG